MNSRRPHPVAYVLACLAAIDAGERVNPAVTRHPQRNLFAIPFWEQTLTDDVLAAMIAKEAPPCPRA